MKSIHRIALAALLGTAGIPAFAQTTTTTTPTAAPACSTAGQHRHDSVLTADERTQLKKAHDAALAANGTLQTDEAALKQQFETLKSQGDSVTKDQWHALHQQEFDFHAKLRAAELLVDPTLTPVFAKLDASHHHGHHSTS